MSRINRTVARNVIFWWWFKRPEKIVSAKQHKVIHSIMFMIGIALSALTLLLIKPGLIWIGFLLFFVVYAVTAFVYYKLRHRDDLFLLMTCIMNFSWAFCMVQLLIFVALVNSLLSNSLARK